MDPLLTAGITVDVPNEFYFKLALTAIAIFAAFFILKNLAQFL